MKKVLITILALVSLAGCSLSNTPSSVVQTYLDNYKNLSDEVITQLEAKVSNEDLSNVNRETYKSILSKQYKDLKYEIKDESIDGDKAEVLAKITVYDLFKADNEANAYMNETPVEFYNDSGVFDNDLFNTYRLNKMNEISDTVDYEIIFKLNKKDGEWILEEPDRDTLEKIHGLYNYKID